MKKHIKTFTLIEMLIVIVIIGIFAAALVPRLNTLQLRARNATRKVDIRTLWNTIQMYYQDRNNFPPNLKHLLTGGLVTSLPIDPRVAINGNVCGAYFTDFDSIYLITGFYNTPNCSADITTCSTVYNGYLYAQSQSLDYATLGARMEDDGTINSYDHPVTYTWIQKLCNWEWDPTPYETNAYNVRWLAIADFQQWMDAKGKVYFNFFHKWSYIY